MSNIGLIATGAVITAFGLLFLNPAFEVPGMATLSGALPIETSWEWAAIAVFIFMVVFLTGTIMMAKGFLEQKEDASPFTLRRAETESVSRQT